MFYFMRFADNLEVMNAKTGEKHNPIYYKGLDLQNNICKLNSNYNFQKTLDIQKISQLLNHADPAYVSQWRQLLEQRFAQESRPSKMRPFQVEKHL